MKKNKSININFILLLITFISISFISIGYSAYNATLSISGEASINIDGSIYISKIELLETTNATESFLPTITTNTTNLGVNVPAANSTFKYKITIKNTDSAYYHLSEINELVYSGEGEYIIENLNIFTEFPPNSETTFYITYKPQIALSNPNFILELEYIFISGGRYKDPILNGSDPEIIDGLIPIIYDYDLGKWLKADVINYQWYDYANRQWANATSVISTMKDTYVEAEPGTIIEMEHMTSMMVWIPRYSYTIKDTLGYQGYGGAEVTIETPGAMNIDFIGVNKIDTGSAAYSGSTPANFYTSSAFCWGNSCDNPATRSDPGNVEIPGFWVAKFEASKVDNLLYSKPNMTPMVNTSMYNTFTYVQSLMNGDAGYDNYGFVGYVDAHTMKNTEWGALAYLSQSMYGKYGNSDYTGANKEIYPNNCTIYTTGIGADSPAQFPTDATCTTNTYDTYYGMGASTTGNIYGVYDTVGGTFDRVMGTVLTSSGLFKPDSSGFTSPPEGRYINIYPYGNYGVTTTPSIKGDALTDTLGFYRDRGVTSVYLSNSWFYRGGSLWSNATYINGIFSYTTYSGIADPNHSSRYTVTIY